MTTLVIATRNAHKVGEIRALLGDGVRGFSLAEFPGAPAIVEDAATFAGNATKKAVELAHWLAARPVPAAPLMVLADDSGLEVDALDGAPGVHSARFAALDDGHSPTGNSPDADNNAKLLRLLRDVPPARRGARFRCVLALVELTPHDGPHDGQWEAAPARLFEGTCEGRMGTAPAGNGGFGYDPLFLPAGHDRSFAELGAEIKNRLSHRARALAQLRAWLNREKAPGVQTGMRARLRLNTDYFP